MERTSDQYRTIAANAGCFDRASRGQIVVSGKDAVSFLHALLSNDVASLEPGQGTYACYLTPQGRMIADMAAYRFADRVLLDVPGAEASRLATRLDQSIFTEDVQIEDRSTSTVSIGVTGVGAATAIAATVDVAAERIAALPLRGHVSGGDVIVARTDDPQESSYDVFVPRADHDRVVEVLEQAGAPRLAAEAAEAIRIETGRPVFGVDMTDETIPLEAGLQDRAISLSKGCYVGQEVIVRVLHRGGGRVAKRLMRLVAADGAPDALVPGAALQFEGREVGRITSAAWSSSRARRVALGYVHRDVAEVGRMLTAGAASVEIAGAAG